MRLAFAALSGLGCFGFMLLFFSLSPPQTFVYIPCPVVSPDPLPLPPRDIFYEYVQLHQQAVQMKRVLLVQLPPTGGLCNRFQTLVSGLALALVTGRALAWDWDHAEPVQANPRERIGQSAFHALFEPLPFEHRPSVILGSVEPKQEELDLAKSQDHVPVVVVVNRYDFWGAPLWEKHPWLPPPDALFRFLFTPRGDPWPLVDCGTLVQRRSQWDRATAPLEKYLQCATQEPLVILDDSEPSMSGYCRNGTAECDLQTIHRMIQLANSCPRAVLTRTSTFGACISSLIGQLRAPNVKWVDDKGNCLAPVHYLPLVEAGTLDHEPRQVLGSMKPQVVVLVLSRRTGYDRRQAIRETWARKHHGVSVFFVLADRDCHWPRSQDLDCAPLPDQRATILEATRHRQRLKDTKQRVHQEQTRYQDLVLVECLEVYRQLPCKLKQAYRWALEQFPVARWFVKADDDSIVRIDRLTRYLLELNPSQSLAMAGCVYDDRSVWRGGKWEELDFPRPVYPPFALGSCGHAVTRELAQAVVELDGHEYQGEDTSMGIWINETGKDVTLINARSIFSNSGNCRDEGALVIGHDISAEQMRSCRVD